SGFAEWLMEVDAFGWGSEESRFPTRSSWVYAALLFSSTNSLSCPDATRGARYLSPRPVPKVLSCWASTLLPAAMSAGHVRSMTPLAGNEAAHGTDVRYDRGGHAAAGLLRRRARSGRAVAAASAHACAPRDSAAACGRPSPARTGGAPTGCPAGPAARPRRARPAIRRGRSCT